MSEPKHELPRGWAWTTIGEIQLSKGSTVDPNRAKEQVFELYSVPSYDVQKPEITRGAVIGSSKQSVEPGTVLLCKINPRINRVWTVGESGEYPQIASTEWIAFSPISGLEPDYLRYFLRKNAVRDFLSANASGVGGSLMRVKPSTLSDYDFPLAPTEEQKRIASKLDELFSELDAGLASIKKAQAKLKAFRASLLRAATSGELSAQWRAENPVEEDGAALLDRILAERRKRWEEAERAKREARAKPGTKKLFEDESWKQRYVAPTGPDASQLPRIPDTWRWTTVEQVGDIQGGITKGQKLKPDVKTRAVPYLRVANVQRAFLDLTEIKTIETTEEEIRATLLKRGDILFNEGGDRDKLGRGWIWEEQLPECCHQNHVFRVRVPLHEINPKWISWWGNSFGQEWFQRKGKQSVNLASINMTVLRAFPFPLPPQPEQEWLVTELEARLSVIDQTEDTLKAAEDRARALRQTILERAFWGGLAPQDPDDESAEDLLERIRLARIEAASNKVRKPQPRRRVAAPSQTNMKLFDEDENGGQQDVSNRIYEALREAKEPLTPEALFRRLNLQSNAPTAQAVDTFYQALREEVNVTRRVVEERSQNRVVLRLTE